VNILDSLQKENPALVEVAIKHYLSQVSSLVSYTKVVPTDENNDCVQTFHSVITACPDLCDEPDAISYMILFGEMLSYTIVADSVGSGTFFAGAGHFPDRFGPGLGSDHN
jgi:hypothetical protein